MNNEQGKSLVEVPGDIVEKGEWFAGYEVPPPIVPEGFKLVGIGIGLCLNSAPPRATAILRQI